LDKNVQRVLEGESLLLPDPERFGACPQDGWHWEQAAGQKKTVAGGYLDIGRVIVAFAGTGILSRNSCSMSFCEGCWRLGQF